MEACGDLSFDLGDEPQSQKALVDSKLLSYSDSLDLESEQLLELVKTNLGKSIVLREINPGAVFWGRQLLRYIQLYGRKFSKEDHILFVKIAYELLTVPDLEVDVVQAFAQLLTLLLKKKALISRQELELLWRPLAQLYERIMYCPRKSVEMLLPSATIGSTLKALVSVCRCYFSVESTQEILDEWRPLLCPFDISSMIKALTYFELFLPTLLPPEHQDKGFKLWFQDMIDIWNACHNSPIWERSLVSLFARLACHNIGYIDWEPYLPMIFTRMLRSFSLPGGSSKFHIVRPFVTYETNAIVMWIVAMLGGGSSCQQHVGRLFRTLESYYHPSNNGTWMGRLHLLLYKLPASLIKRLHLESKKRKGCENHVPEAYKLTDEDVTAFVESMKHVVLLSIFSKGGSVYSSTALKKLSVVRPEIVIPPLLDRLYSSLETLTEPHRLTATMRCVIAVSRTLVSSNKHFVEGPAHVIPLLMNCLPGIDPNDMKKCMVTFRFIETFAKLVPLVDCSRALDVRTDLTEMEQQLCLATAQFEDFVLQFMDRCFALIENSSLQNPSSSDTTRRNAEEILPEVGLFSTFVTILTHSSPEIFSSALSKLHTFVSSHILETRVSGKLAAAMCHSASKVNAELSLRTFLPHLSKLVMALTESCEVLEEEILDDELMFSLLILTQLVRCDGRYLVTYKQTLEMVISRTIQLKSREGYLLVKTLLRFTLKALTSIHPLDFHSVKIDWEACNSIEDYLPIRDWGKPGELTDLHIEWHIPNEEELAFATDLLEKFLRPELQSLEEWSAEQKTMTRKELERSLGIVQVCILGAGEVLTMWQQENVVVVQSNVPLFCVRIKNTGQAGISFADGTNIRLTCASVLRLVLVQILKVYEDDTKSLLLVVKILNALMFFWGVSRVDYTQRVKDYNLAKNILNNKLAGSKQSVRALLVERVYLHHQARMYERSRTALTPLHLSVMDDLLLLAVSHYSQVRSLAQVTLQTCLHHFPFSYRAFTSKIIDLLKKDPVTHHESFKGALYVVLLSCKHNSIMSVNDWDSLHQMWPAIVASQPSEKPSIVRLLNHISQSIYNHLETMQIKLEVPIRCVELAKKLWLTNPLKQNVTFPGDHLMEEGIVYEQQRNENNLKHYLGLINELQDLLESGGLHWRHYQLAFSLLSILTRHDIPCPARMVKCFVQHLIHETLIIRKTAIAAVAAILKQQTRKHIKCDFDASTIDVEALPLHKVIRDLNVQDLPSNLWLQYNSSTNPDTIEKWENTKFINKTHIGFYCLPKPLLVHQNDSQQPVVDRGKDDLTEEEAAVFDCFSDPSFVESFITYLSLEERKGHDRFSTKRFLLFKSLFRNFGDTLLPLFISHIKEKVVDKQDSAQRCAAEILAGILRGSSHWPFEKTKSLQEEVIPILASAFDNVTSETVVDWGMCISSVSSRQDPKKYYWLFEMLMDKPLRGNTGSFLESSRLYLLLVLLTLQEWRVFELLHRLLDFLEPHLMHPYQNVRQKIGRLLCNIFLYDVTFPHVSSTLSLAPKRSTFIHKVLPKLSILMDPATTNGTGNVVSTLKDLCIGTNNNFTDSNSSSIGSLVMKQCDALIDLNIGTGTDNNQVTSTASNCTGNLIRPLKDFNIGSSTSTDINFTVAISKIMGDLKSSMRKHNDIGTGTENSHFTSATGNLLRTVKDLGILRTCIDTTNFSNATPNSTGNLVSIIKDLVPISNSIDNNNFTTPTSYGADNLIRTLKSLGTTNNNFTDTTSICSDVLGTDNTAIDSKEKKDAKNLLRTLCGWLRGCIQSTLYCAPPEMYCFLSVLCWLQCDTIDEELSKDCMQTTAILGQALLLPESISAVIETVTGITKSTYWHSRLTALSFLQLMVFSNLFTVMNNEKWVADITQLVLKLLSDERLEVREKSGETLSGFLHCEFIKVTEEMIETFIGSCKRKLRKRKTASANVNTVEPADIIERHSGILGLCACVTAYPYDVPRFLPEILVKLGDHLNDPLPIPATIKKTLSNFRRTHHDNWRDHKLRFTDDQLAVITDLLVSPSYYA